MFTVTRIRRPSCAILLLIFGAGLTMPMMPAAQSSSALGALRPVAQTNRVQAHADLGPQTQLSGHLPRWATASNLWPRAVDLAAPLHITMVMQRAPAVQAAFEKLLADQQDPNSALYHQWLTPRQVGTLYGPTQADVDSLTAWATAQGLHVDSIAPSRMLLEFSAPAITVASAFRTSFSYFLLNGQPRLSANLEPSIPTALAPIIAAVDGLSDVPVEPLFQSHSVAGPQGAPTARPEFTNGSNHYLTPNDFSTIFDIASVYAGGNTGQKIGSKAQHIAIIDESDLVTQDIADYATRVGITSYTLNTIFATGADPGIGSSQGESTLDVIRTIGTAPGAVTDLIVAAAASGGTYAAASYNVNTLVDPVMTMSWGGCEANNGMSLVTAWDTLFSTAAAEGISSFVSAGDAGAAGCDSHGDILPPTTQALGTNAFCASSYTTCVGGTEFADTGNPSLYWGSSNSSGLGSALSYIPEGAWNSPVDANGNFDVEATGGGVSLYITKPSWQTGTGVPADGYRDTPDISFPAASHDGYYGCLNLNCEKGGFEFFGGTSAAAPGMAGVAALLNMRAGVAQGNLNPLLYRLAAAASTNMAFHDTTIASSGVTGCTLAIPSMCNNSMPSSTALTGGLAGYLLTTGYDQLTGWGSLDVANFLAAASPVMTTLALKASATQASTMQALTFTATLTPAASSVASPSGTVQYYSNGTAIGSPITVSSNVATSAPQTFATAGTYNITAIYSGDAYFVTSTAPAISETIVAVGAAFTVTAASSALTFTSGATTGNTDVLTFTSLNGSSATNITIGCVVSTSSAAFQPTCLINPAAPPLIAGGTSTATVMISSTTATASMDWPAPPRSSRQIGYGSGVMLALLCVLIPRRRRPAFKILALLLFAAFGVMGLTGCSSGSSNSLPTPAPLRSSAGSYTVTITSSLGGVAPVTTTIAVTIN